MHKYNLGYCLHMESLAAYGFFLVILAVSLEYWSKLKSSLNVNEHLLTLVNKLGCRKVEWVEDRSWNARGFLVT